MAAPYANYLIASEELEPGCGWNYSFLSTLNTTSDMDAISKSILSSYEKGVQSYRIVPDYTLSTEKARAALPTEYHRADAVYNIAHGALVLKALELGDEKLLRNAMQDRIHQKYRKKLIPDYEKLESLVRTTGAAFCLSGAGPTLLCITRNPGLQEKLAKKLDAITEAKWEMIPLHVEFQGAHVIASE
jgi:homoserine kinase